MSRRARAAVPARGVHTRGDGRPATSPTDAAGAAGAAGLNLDLILEQLAERTAVHVVAKLQAVALHGWVDQSTSPLGPRKHIQAIRSGALPGIALGRRFLAKAEDVDAYAAERQATPQSDHAPRAAAPEQDVDAIAASLGLDRR